MSSGFWNISPMITRYLLEQGIRESLALKRLRLETEKHPYHVMQICPAVGQLLALLIRLMQATRVIEVGTFTGYSAMAMAEALPTTGSLITCDTNLEWTDVAKKHWEAAGLSDRIDLRLGDANLTLAELARTLTPESIDLVFIDANKAGYLGYYQAIFPLLRRGGICVFDDVLYGGRIFDESNQKDSTRGIREINTFLHQDERIELSMLPIDNGLTIAFKR